MAIENYLIFNGTRTSNFGVYISGEGTFNAPARAVEMITIPGRDGALALDKGYFENIEVTYPAFFKSDNLADMASMLSALRNELCSQRGYIQIADTFHDNEYRLGVYKSGLEVDVIKYNTAGSFDITFDCQPQRFLMSGETPITMGEWGETSTASGNIVEVNNPDGVTAVKSLDVDIEPIQSLNGYDKPWVGGAGKNKLPNTATRTTTGGITFVIDEEGVVSASGTATADAYLHIADGVPLVSGQTYTLSGVVTASQTTYMYLEESVSSSWRARDYGSGATFSAPTNSVNAVIRIASGTTVNNAIFKPMIELGSTATAYEPYSNICPISGRTEVVTHVSPTTSASDGSTYTTSLGRTVYGGTLDVVSGELVVDRGYIASYNGETLPSTWISDRDEYVAGTTPSIGAEVVYTLATPQTYQLTAQQIELITGTNNIWSDGEVTVEFGENPSQIFNPTHFESKPMLEVEGYGTIEFNGFEIELKNAVLGETRISESSYNATAKLNVENLNIGDAITSKSINEPHARLKITTVGAITQYSASVQTGDGSVSVSQQANNILSVTISPKIDGLVYGTSATITTETSVSIQIGNVTNSGTFETTVTYDGNQKITINSELVSSSYPSGTKYTAAYRHPEYYGDSSKPLLGDPTYIDCDLGEAYKYVGDNLISLNQYIDLGSELPTFAAGSNEITFDNTITDLKVIPRWWIV